MNTTSFDLASLHAAYSNGLDPAQVIEDVYARLSAANDPGIFIALADKETLLNAARALGPFDSKAKPLWGIPFAVKDNIDVAGMPTTAACPAFEYKPGAHSPCVAKLVTAGALCIGKTNLDQFATGLVGMRTPYAAPRNAIDPAIVPGGSSSGSAVAVARGIVSFALGTDTAGSGRVPAALNNIVGLKPSLGALSTNGVVPASRSLDCISVFAGSVDDAWAVYSVMHGVDAGDPFSRLVPLGRPGPVMPGLRVGVPDAESRKFFGDKASEESFDQSVAMLASLNAKIVEIDLADFFAVARLLYEGPWVAERMVAIKDFFATQSDALLPVTRSIIGGAKKFSATDTFSALHTLQTLRARTAPVWKTIDAMMLPSIPRPRSVADVAGDPIGPNSELGTYTNFVNLLDLCALAVPAAFRSDGVPSGITFIGPAGQDSLLASIGAIMHAKADVPIGATQHAVPLLPPRITRAQTGEIEIIVVGAHLSGMALNGELSSRHGRFLRVAKTKANYRLFALSGGPPFRPGLLRVEAGQGHAIETEVWALSPAGFGSFIAGIPSPLSIGTLSLADGTQAHGFLVEHAAIAGAQDISHFGGWRAFVARDAA